MSDARQDVVIVCRRLLAGAFAVLLLGCGLSHYEAQMEKEQARLKRMDEREQVLGPPVQLPDKKGRPLVFFRPPKGIGGKGSLHESGVLQRFGRDGSEPTRFQDVSFGAETMKEDDFWTSVLQAFPTKKRSDARLWQRETPVPGALQFDEIFVEDGQYDSYGYVYSKGETHVAVVFRLERGWRDKDAKSIMETSLDSLVIGQEAPRLLAAYKKAKEQEKQQKTKRKETGS